MEIHQLVAGFGEGDAISNYARSLQRLIKKELNIPSEIYGISRHIGSTCTEECFDYRNYNPQDTDIIIYHFSIGSEITEYFSKFSGKKILIYHNITPPRYFRAISDAKAKLLREGRTQLANLAGVPDLSLADSDYNRQELVGMGFVKTGVLNPLMDFSRLNTPVDKRVMKNYGDGRFVNFLFVGRIAPNKKLDDILKIFYYYKKLINPQSRIIIPGSFAGQDKYLAHLRAMCVELDLQDVFFTGFVSQEELLAYYKTADIFLCMSEHEGFCFPLVEAMYFSIPIIAYNSAAIPETLGGSGMLVQEKNFPLIAEAAHELVTNTAFRKNLIHRQNKRLEYFSDERFYEQFMVYMKEFLS